MLNITKNLAFHCDEQYIVAFVMKHDSVSNCIELLKNMTIPTVLLEVGIPDVYSTRKYRNCSYTFEHMQVKNAWLLTALEDSRLDENKLRSFIDEYSEVGYVVTQIDRAFNNNTTNYKNKEREQQHD